MELSYSPRYSSTTRSSNGCWTCRLRRKKCDEKHPVCDTCAALLITCYYDQSKPEWMDGGVRQEEMAERLKCEVRDTAHLRRGERSAHLSADRVSVADATTGEWIMLPQQASRGQTSRDDGMEPRPDTSLTSPRRGADCTLTNGDSRGSIPFQRSDSHLLMFYLDNLFPFLFPFYRPCPLQGGKTWVLEMMLSSPVVRQATLCQSSYFFNLEQETTNHDAAWEAVLTQTGGAFKVLRQALQVIDGSEITGHMHGAVRIMVSIMQVRRFEIAISSFTNCHVHLNASSALFKNILGSAGVVEPTSPTSSFNAVMNRLGPPSWVLPTQSAQIPSAEQAAFRFASALLILDDIVASTVLQEQPKLYEYHRGLFGDIDSIDPPINLEVVVGCQNWALLQIGEISALDAWKQQCKRAGNLDVMELVHRATAIKHPLEAHLTRLENNVPSLPEECMSPLDVFTADYSKQSRTPAGQTGLVTRVWAHAALLYLFVVVSGWQPASVDVRYHVNRIVELLTRQISAPALLRTMVWPFCVAGCLAEPAQEAHFRRMVEVLQPPGVFGTARKALEIIENVWRNRDVGDTANRDLAACFRSHGDLVLLV
ncbi:fungal-specific transcription factor domain-containing protein [Hypoxylon sp. NC1633]|nr:fungal-specific transcription factor domain-containing protein [Hypoxylon sp. NC1633]